MSNFLKILAAILTIGILACIVTIGRVELNSRETTLMGIILAVVSILASWLISHVYAQSQHQHAIREVQEMHRTNLRTYALKAAEKVNNLSNELNRLVLYLEQAISAEDIESIDEALLAREERIASAIHIANTLKSVNDTSLSAWRGVIGEELDQQLEEREEREAELRELLLRVETLEKDQESDLNRRALRSEIESIKNSMRLAIGSYSGTPMNFSRRAKARVEAQCPVCSTPVSYRQKSKMNSLKSVKCPSCSENLVSKYDEKGYSLTRSSLVDVPINCPGCGVANKIKLNSAPGSTTTAECSACHNSIRASRSATDTVRVRMPGIEQVQTTSQQLTEEILDAIRKSLPPQPWPDGIARQVAQKIGVSREIMHQAVKELIKRGVFKPQIDGVLYAPLLPASQSVNSANNGPTQSAEPETATPPHARS